MTCLDFQYEDGKEYETEDAKVCDYGFHACEYPLDCFGYYNPAQSVYHEVEQSGKLSRKGDDSKVASTKIKIGVEISIAGMVKAAIEYIRERAKESEDAHNTGNCGASSNTGYRGAAEVNHPNSVAVAWGPESKAKGVKGATLVFAEWESNGGYSWEEETWTFKGSMMVRVDGERIKEDAWYTMRSGEIVEAEREER